MGAEDGKAKSHGQDLRFAAGAVSGWYGARSGRIAKQTLQRYRNFRRQKAFWTK